MIDGKYYEGMDNDDERTRNPWSLGKNKQRYSHDGHTYTDDHDDDGDDKTKKPIVRTNKDTANLHSHWLRLKAQAAGSYLKALYVL